MVNTIGKDTVVPYSPAAMYALVNDITSYPQFLRWCKEIQILEVHEDGVTARLRAQLAGIRIVLITRNTCHENKSIRMHLVDGPFTHLTGGWRFLSSGEGCHVYFDIEYEFSRRLLQRILELPLRKAADALLGQFVLRAEQLYGKEREGTAGVYTDTQ